jgi:hypothetical protein
LLAVGVVKSVIFILMCRLFVVRVQGISLVEELIDEYGLDVVQAYMGYIQVGLIINYRKFLALKFISYERSNV